MLIWFRLTGEQPWSLRPAPGGGDQKFLICIEGNIGSRKSDFMQKLNDINKHHRLQHVRLIREPVDEDGPGKFREDMTKFNDAMAAGKDGNDISQQQREESSAFERKMFQHHLQAAEEVRTTHVISERSMEAKVRVFNKLSFEQGELMKTPERTCKQTKRKSTASTARRHLL